jgi:hypothetical protein
MVTAAASGIAQESLVPLHRYLKLLMGFDRSRPIGSQMKPQFGGMDNCLRADRFGQDLYDLQSNQSCAFKQIQLMKGQFFGLISAAIFALKKWRY